MRHRTLSYTLVLLALLGSLLFLLVVLPEKKSAPTEIVPTAAITNTPYITPTALPTITPTPLSPRFIEPRVGLWQARALQITNDFYGFSWLNNSLIRISTYPIGVYYTLDLNNPSQEPLAYIESVPTPTPTVSTTTDGFLMSPDGSYRLDCAQGLELRQLKGDVRIDHVAITPIRPPIVAVAGRLIARRLPLYQRKRIPISGLLIRLNRLKSPKPSMKKTGIGVSLTLSRGLQVASSL